MFIVGAEDLDKVDVLRGINEFARKFLAANMTTVAHNAGTLLMRKSEVSENCSFILDGICHVRNNDFSTDKEDNTGRIVERHQGFRGIGDSLGITSALAHYAHQSQDSPQLGNRKQEARELYERFLGVGSNTANTYAVTRCQLLVCSRDTLLTAIQICPFLVANIARAISLRIQQETMLEQRAALNSHDCLPLLAQFLYEWHMVVAAYEDLGSGKQNKVEPPQHKKIQEWLRINDERAIASAFRFLQMEDGAIKAFMEVKEVSDKEAIGNRALYKDETVVGARELLLWCSENQSRRLIMAEQAGRKGRAKSTAADNTI